MKCKQITFAIALLIATTVKPVFADIYAGRGSATVETNTVMRFSDAQSGNVAPISILGGAATTLQSVDALHFDTQERVFYIGEFQLFGIRVFSEFANGNSAPLRTINISSVLQPRSLTTIHAFNELIVLGYDGVFTVPRNASGTVFPTRRISGASTQIDNAGGLLYLAASDALMIGDYAQLGPSQYEAEILVFPRTADTGAGAVPPTRRIAGNLTGLGTFVIDIAMRESSNELFVLSNSLLPGDPWVIQTFALNGNGNIAPLRSIRGSNTQMQTPTAITYDPLNDQIVVSSDTYNSTNLPKLLFFTRTANGNIAPVKIISGANTGAPMDSGWNALVAVDHNPLFSNGFE